MLLRRQDLADGLAPLQITDFRIREFDPLPQKRPHVLSARLGAGLRAGVSRKQQAQHQNHEHSGCE